MNRETKDLLDRTLELAIQTIVFTRSLPSDAAGQTVARQVIRSASSVGANLREAHRARSKAEFVSKVQIGLQEICETEYWLEVIRGSDTGDPELAQSLLDEVRQLTAIFAAITRTTKARLERRSPKQNS